MSLFDLANRAYGKTQRYHLVAECSQCKYAEEAVFAFSLSSNLAATQLGTADLSEYCDRTQTEEQNAWRYVDDMYHGKGFWKTRKPHPHPVVFKLEKTKEDILDRHQISYPAF